MQAVNPLSFMLPPRGDLMLASKMDTSTCFPVYRRRMGIERDSLRRRVAERHDEKPRTFLRRLGSGNVPATADNVAIVRQAQEGDTSAREQLIERFLPFIESLARTYRADGLEHIDLVQEGCVGLLRALVRYDADRGVPFAAYATWWIRHALQEARSDFLRPFRLPPKALRQLSQLKSEHQRIHALERREPDERELSERTGIELGQVQSLLAADAQTRSLHEPVVGAEGQVGIVGDLLVDPASADVYAEVLETIAGEQVRSLLGQLTARERDVVNARFGFDQPAEGLMEIGQRLGISGERVRQIEERALAKLRHDAVSSGSAAGRRRQPGDLPRNRLRTEGT